MSVARSILYAAANLLHPRMLWLMLWPMLIAVAIWGSLALLLWGRLALRIALWLQQGIDYALAWAHLDLGAAALVAASPAAPIRRSSAAAAAASPAPAGTASSRFSACCSLGC